MHLCTLGLLDYATACFTVNYSLRPIFTGAQALEKFPLFACVPALHASDASGHPARSYSRRLVSASGSLA